MSLVSIIVPTYNSAHFLGDFLHSLARSDNKNFEVIINDDVRTSDQSKKLVTEFAAQSTFPVRYMQKNYSMAQGRKRGAAEAKGNILLHLDSDMQVTPGLINECIEKISGGYDALVIPEESFGTTFWARCKWLEKKCYDGVEEMESLRCLRKAVYKKVDGHNAALVFGEDRDLSIRVKKAGYKVGRTQNHLRHNEGDLKLTKTLRKKRGYAASANLFAEIHPEAFRWQKNILNRYVIYLKNMGYITTHPLLYMGMIIMKTCEFGSGAIDYFGQRIKGQAEA